MTVLALNTGSSSLKYALFEGANELQRGIVEGEAFAGHEAALDQILDGLDATPEAVGHRLVHGGERYVKPTLLTPEVMVDLRTLIPFAPLHLPRELAVVDAIHDLPQVGCFDTAFHASMPESARRFPLPKTLWEGGVKRYGFHGLSYDYIVQKLGDTLPARTVIAHLGSGASLAAIKEGKSIDTTMGFTPTGGVVMGTRCGDLDPGILLYCVRELGMDEAHLSNMVDHQSGLLALGGTSDMKTLLEKRSDDPSAALAIEIFVRSAAKAVGSLATVLGGLDLLVFTGGIGEGSSQIRDEISSHLSHLNAAIATVPTDEEKMIATYTYGVIHGQRSFA